MWWRRQFNVNWVTDPDFATGQNNAHDTGLADEISLQVVLQGRLHQARPNALQLSARIAQASHHDDCRIAQMQSGVGWQRQQVEPRGGDILAHLSRPNFEARSLQLVE